MVDDEANDIYVLFRKHDDIGYAVHKVKEYGALPRLWKCDAKTNRWESVAIFADEESADEFRRWMFDIAASHGWDRR